MKINLFKKIVGAFLLLSLGVLASCNPAVGAGSSEAYQLGGKVGGKDLKANLVFSTSSRAAAASAKVNGSLVFDDLTLAGKGEHFAESGAFIVSSTGKLGDIKLQFVLTGTQKDKALTDLTIVLNIYEKNVLKNSYKSSGLKQTKTKVDDTEKRLIPDVLQPKGFEGRWTNNEPVNLPASIGTLAAKTASLFLASDSWRAVISGNQMQGSFLSDSKTEGKDEWIIYIPSDDEESKLAKEKVVQGLWPGAAGGGDKVPADLEVYGLSIMKLAVVGKDKLNLSMMLPAAGDVGMVSLVLTNYDVSKKTAEGSIVKNEGAALKVAFLLTSASVKDGTPPTVTFILGGTLEETSAYIRANANEIKLQTVPLIRF